MVYRIADNIVSPLGETTAENYQAIKTGSSALCRYDHRWQIPEPFTASLFTEAQGRALAVSGLTRFEALAYASARRAIEDAAICVATANTVFILSTTKGNIELIGQLSGDDRPVYPGTAARHIAEKLGITTLPVTVCNACISGVSAIILGMRLIEAGQFDYAVVCGADVQSKFTVSGFQSLKAVAEEACRPFDMERVGLNLGEAAATIVLGREKPSADSWAILRGAVRNDAFHISSPSKNGEGARLALSAVTKDTDTGRLAFINAHGTATMFNDQMESVAIERAALNTIPVNALKGYYGHTLGAAGILETVLSMAAADDHTIIGTRGFAERGVSGRVLLSSENAITCKHDFVKMISGFGGGNGAILVGKEEQGKPCVDGNERGSKRGCTIRQRVSVTPAGAFVNGRKLETTATGKALLTELYKCYVDDYPRYYKMDGLCRLGFIASELLLQAEGHREEAPREDWAVVFANRSSSIGADKCYQASIQDAENYYPSPAAFVYTLPNIVTGEIAIRNHYLGETSFYILPEKDDNTIAMLIEAAFQDTATKYILGGWIDYPDDAHFEAETYIIMNDER